MNREDRKELYTLIEQWTRCEIMARLGPVPFPGCAEYHFKMKEKEDEIRKLMFGTNSLLKLGKRWGLVKKDNDNKKKRKKHGTQKTLHKNRTKNKSCR